jgi:8-oxo-dGTP diphosphatase
MNSKPTVSAMIELDGQILLGLRSADPEGMWDVPGGFLEDGEHPHDGLRREVREEVGVEVEVHDLIGIFTDFYEPAQCNTLNICYIAKITAGEPLAGDDLAELQWFAPEELPQNIAFENGKEMINAWLIKNGYKPFYHTNRPI